MHGRKQAWPNRARPTQPARIAPRQHFLPMLADGWTPTSSPSSGPPPLLCFAPKSRAPTHGKDPRPQRHSPPYVPSHQPRTPTWMAATSPIRGAWNPVQPRARLARNGRCRMTPPPATPVPSLSSHGLRNSRVPKHPDQRHDPSGALQQLPDLLTYPTRPTDGGRVSMSTRPRQSPLSPGSSLLSRTLTDRL